MTGHLTSERRVEPAVRFASGPQPEWHTVGVVAVRGDGRDDVPRWALVRSEAHAGPHHVFAHPQGGGEPVVYEVSEEEVPVGWVAVELVAPSPAAALLPARVPPHGGVASILGGVVVLLPVVGWMLGVLVESNWHP